MIKVGQVIEQKVRELRLEAIHTGGGHLWTPVYNAAWPMRMYALFTHFSSSEWAGTREAQSEDHK